MIFGGTRFFTWRCEVCGEERPDEKISVAHRPVPGHEASFPNTRRNVKYCNDKKSCIDWATAEGPWKGRP